MLYETYETAFLEWLILNDQPLGLYSLNSPNVREASQWVKTRHGGKRGGQSAMHTFVSTMKTWCHFLVEHEYLEADFLTKVRLPKKPTPTERHYEAWEIQALKGALNQGWTGPRDVAIFALLLDTGMRSRELCKLNVEDVDMKGRRVIVRDPKNKHDRSLPFGSDGVGQDRTTRLLRDYEKQRGVGGPKTPFFKGHHGNRLTTAAFRAQFWQAAKGAEVTDGHPHRTRHTFAVRWLTRNWERGDGAKLETLRYLMGHLHEEQYQTYCAAAGEIISRTAGRASIADEMFSESPKPSTRRVPRPKRLD